MQYEIVIKVIGGVHVILAFLEVFLLLSHTRSRSLELQRLHIYSRSQRQKNIHIRTHTCNQEHSEEKYTNTIKQSVKQI